MSRKTSIQLDDSAPRAFNELKDNLIAQIELVQPDYNKKFTLTTDGPIGHLKICETIYTALAT